MFYLLELFSSGSQSICLSAKKKKNKVNELMKPYHTSVRLFRGGVFFPIVYIVYNCVMIICFIISY